MLCLCNLRVTTSDEALFPPMSQHSETQALLNILQIKESLRQCWNFKVDDIIKAAAMTVVIRVFRWTLCFK